MRLIPKHFIPSRPKVQSTTPKTFPRLPTSHKTSREGLKSHDTTLLHNLCHRHRRAHAQSVLHPLPNPSEVITPSPTDSIDTRGARAVRGSRNQGQNVPNSTPEGGSPFQQARRLQTHPRRPPRTKTLQYKSGGLVLPRSRPTAARDSRPSIYHSPVLWCLQCDWRAAPRARL